MKEILTAHMIIRLKDGSIAENTRKNARPARIVLGDGSVSEAFEAAVRDLNIGEKKTFELSMEDAFGQVMEGNLMQFPRTQFGPEVELEEGMMIEFQNTQGGILIGIVRELTDDGVKVDFNHPLAGHDLEIEIEILERKEEAA